MGIHDGQADGVDKLDDPCLVAIRETESRDKERLGAFCTRCPECLFQLFRAVHFQGLDVHTSPAGDSFDFLEMRRSRRASVLIREMADPRNVWERLLQQF
jgi:hypothetical protein